MQTDPATLDELLKEVAPKERSAFTDEYRALSQLPATDCGMTEFLNQYLEAVMRLFSAEAGAIWFRSADDRSLQLRAAVNFRTQMEGVDGPAHDILVRHALTRRDSFLIRPFGNVNGKSHVTNPMGSFVLLGPASSHGDRVAVVELFLGASPRRLVITGGDEGDTQPVRWLDQLVTILVQGIEQRFHGNLAPLQPALADLDATRAEIEAYKDAIRISLEITLNHYAGWNFGSLRNNQTFTRSVHELLDANSLRVECPECGAPAILRCQLAGNSKTGVFLYDHYLQTGRTFHGGPSTFPQVKLTAKPPRRRNSN